MQRLAPPGENRPSPVPPYASFEVFSHADTGPLLVALAPSTIRWPGGTEADFYDWHTGATTRKAGRVPFTLSDLAAAYRATGAVPIFDLNVLTPANRTDPADQIAMLKQAEKLGLPIDYVEVGNELYAGQPGFKEAYPDGTAYARTVSIYVKALHEAFPGVKVAADAIPFAVGQREKAWDAGLRAGVSGAGAPDAYIVHFYPNLDTSPFDSRKAALLFENVFSSIRALSSVVASFAPTPVWLTEYNMRSPYEVFRKMGEPPAEKTFAHELYNAAFAAMLLRVPGLSLVDNWTAFADGFYGAWQDPAAPHLTPGGQGVAMVDTAARGAISADPIPVLSAPPLVDREAGVIGERFVHPGGSLTALLVNLTPSEATVATSAWLRAGMLEEQVSGNPVAQMSTAPDPSQGSVGATGLRLPPYSVTLVGADLAS